MSAPWENDEAVLVRLGAVLDELDPMPAEVLSEGRALFGLRRLDEELAELVRDSAEDRSGLLAVRGEGDVRLISFETGPVTVELQVTERGAVRDLVAQVTGTALVGAEVETSAGRRDIPIEDSLFTVEDIPAGFLRLRLHTVAGRHLVTSWVRA
ncbi:MAG TPA: hypothetical protein VNC80_01210 [Mycobacteriales bacterium]|jgi:hypothetical protein|nr:hypothetical protein [Mycobacteriales bacterium]